MSILRLFPDVLEVTALAVGIHRNLLVNGTAQQIAESEARLDELDADWALVDAMYDAAEGG